MASKTFRLFKALSGFLLGMAAVLDMGATLNSYTYNGTAEEADRKAIAADWEETGKDLSKALEGFNKGHGY